MPIRILHQDITQLSCDAIVNPTDERFTGLGGVDGAVHRAAGHRLRKACDSLAPLQTGEVCYTKGYQLKSKYIIHTVGPRWQGGDQNEAALLRGCYTKALALCEELGAKTVAFPLISSGTFGFPKNQVLRIALDAVSAYLLTAQNDLDVTLCVLNRDAYSLAQEDGLRAFLAEREPVEPMNLPMSCAAPPVFDEAPRLRSLARPAARETKPRRKPPKAELPRDFAGAMQAESEKPCESLDEWLRKQDDTFAVTLLKLIDKKGVTDVECYKRSNVSRKTFSKINTQKDYRPSKQTVLAFAVGLELTLDETETLLRSAGFSLSPSYTADRIVEYFIRSGNYDVFEINAALYQYDQVLLGC